MSERSTVEVRLTSGAAYVDVADADEVARVEKWLRDGRGGILRLAVPAGGYVVIPLAHIVSMTVTPERGTGQT